MLGLDWDGGYTRRPFHRSKCSVHTLISLSSPKPRAFEYAKNIHNQSRYKAIISTRVILGNVYGLTEERHDIVKPPRGFDSVSFVRQ